MTTTPRLRLGQLLVDARLITPEALDDVLTAQKADGRRIGILLVERGHISEVQLTQILSHQLSVPWVSLHKIDFSRQLLNLVPQELAERYCLLPIYVRRVRNHGDTLYIAMDDPTNEDALRACAAYAGLPVRPMIAPPSDIRSAIRVYYGRPTAETEPPPAAGPEDAAAPAAAPDAAAAPPAEASPAATASAPAATASATGAAAEEASRSPNADGSAAAGGAGPAAGASPAADGSPAADASPAADGSPAADASPAAEVYERETLPADEPAAADESAPAASERETLAPGDLIAAHAQGGAAAGRAVVAFGPVAGARPATHTTTLRSAIFEEGAPRGEGAAGAPPEDIPPIVRDSRPTPLPGSERGRAREDDPVIEVRPLRPRAPDHSAERSAAIPSPRGKTPRMVSLTLLDGTTITLPAPRKKGAAAPQKAPSHDDAPPESTRDPSSTLTARDLVDALRAIAAGADARALLGEEIRWETMFAALLSTLLKKQIIADWEFVEELHRLQKR